jgi:uncharacterized SAM-binding protein YcdF (DUF218 family)
MDLLWLKAAIKALVLPPTGLLLAAAIGLALHSRLPRGGRALAAAGVLGLLVLAMPVTADFLTQFVDVSPVLEPAEVRQAQAIVILGGGIRRDAPEYGGDTLGILTLQRVRYGARVARLTGLPVLVTGGSVLGGEPEANLMQASLQDEFGVPVRWVEAHSRNTHENAVLSAEILRKESVRRVVLVAHGFDMRRATAEFAAQGIETVAAPTGKRGATPVTVLDFVPSIGGMVGSHYATYEILANLVLRVSNR